MTARSTHVLFLGAGTAALVVLALFALASGRFALSASDVVTVLFSPITGETVSRAADSVVFNVRLPRVILAVAAGAGLAAAGAAFQSVFTNALATPDTLGVASGSAFGAVLAILLGLPAVLVQGVSLVAGLAAVALVWAVSTVRGKSSVLMLILSGLVVAALFSALISLVKYVADPQDVLPSITFWMMGSMTGASMKSLAMGLPFIVAGCAVLWVLRWKLNALSLPADEAKSLGIPVVLLRCVFIIAATMVSASVVSMCGLIGWVGLLVPHFVRLVVGHDNMRVIPASLVYGALFMLACDTAARSLTQMEIPVSILTAVFGAPVFLLLLHRGRTLA